MFVKSVDNKKFTILVPEQVELKIMRSKKTPSFTTEGRHFG